MVTRVFISRRLPRGGLAPEVLPELYPLLNELRMLAIQQPGYISGETLHNIEDPAEYLVISTWKSLEDWNRWAASDKRRELQNRVDALLGRPAEYKIYGYD